MHRRSQESSTRLPLSEAVGRLAKCSVATLLIFAGLALSGCGSTGGSGSGSTGGGGTTPPAATVTIAAAPASITAGATSTLTVAASNATAVTVSGSDGSSYKLLASGGTQAVTPSATTTYTAQATGTGGNATATATVTVTPAVTMPTVTITASPTSITAGSSSTLTVTAKNASSVTLTGSDSSNYTLSPAGGTQVVSPASTTTYTAQASGSGGNATAAVTVTVNAAASLQSIQHIVFMLQENHTFDNYFGMLNPYRAANGWDVGDDGKTYQVDGIDDKLSTISNVNDEGQSFSLFKLKTSCIDDGSSAWLESYGDVNRYDFLTTRGINMDGFVHDAEGYARSCATSGTCAGDYSDTAGQRMMGYYDQDLLNYYYYMAANFAVSDRWFSPIATKSNPNRIATYTGGTTQGLVYDPGSDDHLGGLDLPSVFQALDQAGVSWKVYYSDTNTHCMAGEDDCSGSGNGNYPATALGYINYTHQYLYENPTGAPCTGTTHASSVVGDTSNYFCIDTNHVAPLSQYFTDLNNGTLASFAFIEAGYGVTDEHPASGQSVLLGQSAVAGIINALMSSSAWKDSVFFFSYDEGGGPYDHVPPVPGHSNDNTSAALGTVPDIGGIAVNPDSYGPCVPAGGVPTTHCDLRPNTPGANPGDAAAVQGFSAQIGFRVPNMVISPFTRRHYVSHVPMDHTAVIKFVESRFIGPAAHLTARDAAQPDLLDFFDFTNVPWATPPDPPDPVTAQSLGYNPCTPAQMGP